MSAVAAARTWRRPSVGAALGRTLRIILADSAGRVGVALLLINLFVAFAGPAIAPYPPQAIALGAPAHGPTASHWLGTDTLGRDVLSRFLNGGQTIIVLPVLAVLFAFSIGATLGLLGGYKGGVVDVLVTRAADIFMSLPPLLLVLVIVIVLGGSYPVLVLVVGLFFAPRIVRIVRGATLAVCSQDYVVAARARGERTGAILAREILPNITGPLLAELAMRLNHAIIFISTLNFLGLGVQPPAADWGLMVSEGRIVLGQAPLVALTPALAIALLAISVNLISDQIGRHLARDLQRGARI